MTTFVPRSKFPLPVKLLVGAGVVVAVIAPLLNLVRRGAWQPSEWAAYFFGICLMAALGWLIAREVLRQMHVSVSPEGVVVDVWRINVKWPFLGLNETRVPWSSVTALRRAGLTLILHTHDGKRNINLFLFEHPQQVERFAVETWRAKVDGARPAV